MKLYLSLHFIKLTLMRLLNLFSFLLMGIFGLGQGYWETINPYPTANPMRGVCFVTPDIGWIIADNGNLLKTEDGGQSWEFQQEDTGESFRDVFFLDENEGWVCGKNKVFHTIDGGNNWEIKNLPGQYLSTSSIFFLNSELGWTSGSYDRLHRTVNGGEHWQLVYSGYYTEVTIIEDIEFYDENHGIAVGGYMIGNDTAVILTTNDGGQNWDRTTFPNFEGLRKVDYLSENTIIAVGDNGNVFRSTDGGETWIVQDIGSSLTDVHFFNEMDGIALSYSRVMHTSDGGLSWEEGVYLNAGHFSFSGSTGYAVGYNANIYKTEDSGKMWNLISKSKPVGTLTNASFVDTLTIWASRYNDSLLSKTSNGGYDWDTVNIGASGNILDVCFLNPNVGYAIEKTEKIHKTVDGGENWEEIHIGNNFHFSCFGFENDNKGYIGGKNGLLLRTTSGGQSWVNISPSTEGEFIGIKILDDGEIWALNTLGSVYYTSNSGVSWEEKITNAYGNLTGFYFFDENQGFIFTENGEQFKTYDGGETWEIEILFYPYQNPVKIEFFDDSDGWLLRGSSLYYTSDKGETWINIPSNPGKREIIFLPPYTGLICGSNNLIMKYHKMTTNIPIVEKESLIVYPNPSSSFVHINIDEVCLDENLTVKVIDIMGRLRNIQKIQHSKEEIILDVASWEKGMYFISIQSENRIIRRTKLLVQ